MKEVTYEDWQKNPTPRMMWVWDYYESRKEKRKVIYIDNDTETELPVIALSNQGKGAVEWKHCAEIEEPRRMTHQELAWWLQDGKHREYKDKEAKLVKNKFEYYEETASEEVYDNILIREDNGQWHEPLVEVEQ